MFFFNNNQQGVDEQVTLQAWAQIALVDLNPDTDEQIFLMGGNFVGGIIPPVVVLEPGPMLLLGVELIGLGAIGRKRFMKKS